MANEFVYRADPPGELTATGDIAALASKQEQSGLNLITPGTPVTSEEIKKSPDDSITRLSNEIKAATLPSGDPVKVCLPLPGPLDLDHMLLSGLLGNLVDDGAKVLEFDGSAYADPAFDPSSDEFTLMGLPRPEGFRLAIHLGKLSAWNAERLEEVASTLAADRYVFSIDDGDDYDLLKSVPEEAVIVLGLVDPSGGRSDDDILGKLDDIAEVIDQDRLALTAKAGLSTASEDVQAKVLRQIADVTNIFWGFAV